MTTVVVGGGTDRRGNGGRGRGTRAHGFAQDFDHIDPARARVILIEGGSAVLGTFPSDLSEKARQLERLGVEVRTRTRVQDIREGEVVLANETIPRETSSGRRAWRRIR